MGKITELFSSEEYRNEDYVEQNFIIPFLTNFLGYKRKNILPKEEFKVKKAFQIISIPINRDKKRELMIRDIDRSGTPDFIVVNDEFLQDFFKNKIDNHASFLVEAKHPNESLEKYKHQLNAYCSAITLM